MDSVVAVLMGGSSSERSVSIASGKACAEGLSAAGYRVAQLDVNGDVAEKLLQVRPSIVFNSLHGTGGEDGIVQGLLESLGIPYTHSGVMASALAMHKVNAKHVAAAHGIPVADAIEVTASEAIAAHVMQPPYVLKPVSDGSSCGVQIIRAGDAPPVLQSETASLMVERYVAGRELTCAVMGGEALGITEIVVEGGAWYDFTAKYAVGGSTHICPAVLPLDVEEKIRRYSETAHRAIGCRGVTRSDFRYDPATGELIWLEINTQPGMTPTSLLPEIAAHRGISFQDLVSWIVEDASLKR